MTPGSILWQPEPDSIAKTPMMQFAKAVEDATGKSMKDYASLHEWSVDDLEGFWSLVWDYCGVVGQKGEVVTGNGLAMPGTSFFPDAKLNFAENLLKKTGSGDAIIFRGEDKVRRRMSWDELRANVSKLQQFFKNRGISRGDRIAAIMPNMPETIIGLLAASSLGAVWSSCSPDFGEQGVLDRFGQIEPKLLLACDGYWYNGKKIEIAGKLAAIEEKLPSVETVVVVQYLGQAEDVCNGLNRGFAYKDACDAFEAGAISCERLAFDHPLYILFSSGTTGIPKCIVHCQGGVLLKHLKEQQLHCSIRPDDRFFYFTTCGWMMWNWLLTGLASGATLMLYDGSPFYPDGNVLFDYAQEERFTFFGTSAKFIDAVRKAGLEPGKTHDLKSVNMIASTGSPLAPENFGFVYDSIKKDVHLASISGGTDIAGCFVGGIPTLPVRVGEIQGPMLAMAVEIWDDAGNPVRQEKGELVCTKPFPSMPVGFWNDPEGKKYHETYFSRFDGVWCHGDFAEWTQNGGIVIHGRSDATLNPGGVRIGTAEIYNQVEQMEEVLEAICIGQDWEGDARVVLFTRLAEGIELTDDLAAKIRNKIRTGASPRHVPAKIIKVADIPRTKSGKITELAVRDVVHGRPVKNQEALANPEALDLFKDLPELQS